MPQAAQDIPKKLRRLLPFCLWATAFVYFAFHTFHGDRGLAQWQQLSADLSDAQAQASDLEATRSAWAHRVKHLGSQSLDLDLLEERARVMLNMGRSADVVIIASRG